MTLDLDPDLRLWICSLSLSVFFWLGLKPPR